MGDLRPVEPGDVVAALDGAAPPPPAVLSAGQEVIAAAGAWGSLGAVMVLRRDEEGRLEDDTYLLPRDSTGTWIEPASSSGSGKPEWVLSRPAGAFEPWHGAHLWVLTGQLAQVAGHGWCGDVTVMVSKAATAVEFVHAGERHRVQVPASGLVGVARPVGSWRDEVRVRAVDAHGVELGCEVYPFLTDADRGGLMPICGLDTGRKPERLGRASG